MKESLQAGQGLLCITPTHPQAGPVCTEPRADPTFQTARLGSPSISVSLCPPETKARGLQPWKTVFTMENGRNSEFQPPAKWGGGENCMPLLNPSFPSSLCSPKVSPLSLLSLQFISYNFLLTPELSSPPQAPHFPHYPHEQSSLTSQGMTWPF